MKTRKLLLVCAVGIVGGCATTSQMDNANIQIGTLESRIARIEKDLYRVAQAGRRAEVRAGAEVEQNVIDTKIDAFLKEYLGVQFGDSIDLYPTLVRDGFKDWLRYIQVKKPFGYLDKAIGRFIDGKLYSVSFVADIDKKYSEDSVNERINQTLADLAVSLDCRAILSPTDGGDSPNPPFIQVTVCRDMMENCRLMDSEDAAPSFAIQNFTPNLRPKRLPARERRERCCRRKIQVQ